jgi:hypothetical protein
MPRGSASRPIGARGFPATAQPPQTALGRAIWDASCAEGVSVNERTVLERRRDPFRLDVAAQHRDGQWVAAQLARFKPHGTVHIRGLHYLLVAAGGIVKPDGAVYRNTDEDWNWLMERASKAARWLGYVPFARIVDQRNNEPEVWEAAPDIHPYASISVGAHIEVPELASVLPDVWGSGFAGEQPYRIIFIGEKSSLGPVLRPLAGQVRGELILANGEMSDTLIYEMAQRAAADGRPAVILYFADFDPSGHEMPANVARKLQALTIENFPKLVIEVHAVALTLDQVRQYNLPSTLLKETEKRGDRWRRAMGHEPTEIDALAALQPEVLRAIAEDAVEPFFDFCLAERVREAHVQWHRQAEAALHAHPSRLQRCL